MEKMRMETENLVEENIKKLMELFPSVVTETVKDGKVERAVDFDALKQELSDFVVEGNDERYQFNWPDKKKARLLANSPVRETLRPCVEESVNFDTTQNLYIEGNNLDVLKLLRESYYRRIKAIYIDPPYNTGNNILYMNDFSDSVSEYVPNSGQYDESGNKLVQNTESCGRFHTNWLNIIYPLIKLSKDFLSEDGYIVIAIDDNELYNLKKICDEIYGEQNYIGTIVTRCNPQGRNKNNIDPVHEYHLVYARNYMVLPPLKIKKESSNIENAYGYLMRSGTNSRKNERPYRFYPMLLKDGIVSTIEENEYKKIYNSQTGFDEGYILELKSQYEAKGYNFILPISRDREEKVWQRTFERVKRECGTYIFEGGQIKIPLDDDRTPTSLWINEKYSNVSNGTNQLKQLFGSDSVPFDFSKSIYTVKDLISLNTSNSDIVMDFFSGSATTAHAVMQLNTEDGGTRRFILVQLPEICAEESTAYKLGYKNICEIGKDRIRRAGRKIKEDAGIIGQDIDTGFRNLKLDSSNMKDVYYKPDETSQQSIEDMLSNVKEDRTPMDLLFQVMLETDVLLSSKIDERTIEGKKVFVVNDNDLICCFDDDIGDDVVKAIAQMKPLYAVFRDSSFKSDDTMVNAEQYFRTYAPDTTYKVV